MENSKNLAKIGNVEVSTGKQRIEYGIVDNKLQLGGVARNKGDVRLVDRLTALASVFANLADTLSMLNEARAIGGLSPYLVPGVESILAVNEISVMRVVQEKYDKASERYGRGLSKSAPDGTAIFRRVAKEIAEENVTKLTLKAAEMSNMVLSGVENSLETLKAIRKQAVDFASNVHNDATVREEAKAQAKALLDAIKSVEKVTLIA